MRTESYLSIDVQGKPVVLTVRTYDAPHKLQSTTPRPHRRRAAWDALRSSYLGRSRPVFGGRV